MGFNKVHKPGTGCSRVVRTKRSFLNYLRYSEPHSGNFEGQFGWATSKSNIELRVGRTTPRVAHTGLGVAHIVIGIALGVARIGPEVSMRGLHKRFVVRHRRSGVRHKRSGERDKMPGERDTSFKRRHKRVKRRNIRSKGRNMGFNRHNMRSMGLKVQLGERMPRLHGNTRFKIVPLIRVKRRRFELGVGTEHQELSKWLMAD